MLIVQKYWEVLFFKAATDLRAEAAKTYVGVLWWIFDPIITMATFYLVFAVLLGRGVENFVQFLLIGLVAWRWFQGTLINGADSINAARGLMRQIYLPKIIFPLVVVLTDLFKFAVVLALLLVFLWVSGFTPSLTYLALPLVLFCQLILVVGCTILLAGLVPFLPDLKIIANHVLQVMMFLSGIFYDTDMIPQTLHSYYFLNPMAVLIEAYRAILMRAEWPNFYQLSWVILLACLINGAAWWLLRRCDRLYPKLVVN